MLKDHTWAERIVYPVIIPASCVTKKEIKKQLFPHLSLSVCDHLIPSMVVEILSRSNVSVLIVTQDKLATSSTDTVHPVEERLPLVTKCVPQVVDDHFLNDGDCFTCTIGLTSAGRINYKEELYMNCVLNAKKNTYMSHNWHNVTVIPALGRDRVVGMVCKGYPKAASLIQRLLSCSHSCVK